MNTIEKYMYIGGAIGVIINIPIFFDLIYYDGGLSSAMRIPLNIFLFVIESIVAFIIGAVLGAITGGIIKDKKSS